MNKIVRCCKTTAQRLYIGRNPSECSRQDYFDPGNIWFPLKLKRLIKDVNNRTVDLYLKVNVSELLTKIKRCAWLFLWCFGDCFCDVLVIVFVMFWCFSGWRTIIKRFSIIFSRRRRLDEPTAKRRYSISTLGRGILCFLRLFSLESEKEKQMNIKLYSFSRTDNE